MKQCPQCGREYDKSMMFCLDDGAELLYGPGSMDEPATVLLHPTGAPGDTQTRAQISTTKETAILLTNTSGFDKRLIAAPLVLVLVILGSFFGYQYLKPSAGEGPINSIAVLPFQNKSGDPNSEYLSDGLAESLIYRLTQLPNLKVSPTSAVIRYKGKESDVAKIASELGVDAVMTGRLAQIADNLTISVELVDVRNNKLLWGDQYDRKMTDLLAIQREIASTIAQKLQLKLSGDDTKGITKKYTDNNDAYQFYLKGRFYGAKRTRENAQKSIESYEQAVALDPKFALAYAGLAEANWFLALYSYPQMNEAMPKARGLALKAIELDGSLAEPHSILGVICNTYDRDFACMERENLRAVELNPNYSEGHRRYGLVLENTGQFAEARLALDRALAIDPFSPVTNYEVAHLLFFERKYEESEARGKKNLELDPNFWYARLHLFYTYRIKRDHAAAIEELAKVQDARGEPDAAKLIRESFAGGDWQASLRTITSQRERLKLYPYFVAGLFAELGEKDKAFAAMDEAIETKDQHTSWMKFDPFMDPLRDDPRFKQVLRKAGFPE
jgi:adenylate cyclase